MKKNNIIMAVTAAMLAYSGIANAAALNLVAATATGGTQVASEAIIATAGTTVTLAAATADQLTRSKTGLAVGTNTAAQFFVRYTLSSGAQFVTAPAVPTIGVAATPGTAAPAKVAASSTQKLGGAGSAFVVYQIDTGATAILVNDVLNLTQVNVKVNSKTAVTMTVKVFSTLNAANPANTTAVALSTASGTKISFATSLQVKAQGAVTPLKIDVASGSAKFVTSTGTKVTLTQIGNPIADAAATPGIALAGGAAVYGTSVAAGTIFTVNGDFTAAQNLTGTTPNGTYTGAALNRVFLDTTATANNACNNVSTAATSVSATKATFNLGVTPITAATQLCLNVNGVSQIIKGAYTLDFAPTSVASYTAGAVNGVAMSTLVKNGTTRTVLNIPSSTVALSKKAFIRISNTSSQAGVVRGTLYNEAGTVLLNNVVLVSSLAKNSTFVLGSGNATGAAGALEALGAAVWTGRATLVIDGETPSLEVQGLVSNISGTVNVQTNLSSSSK